jgi:hypothetical protein
MGKLLNIASRRYAEGCLYAFLEGKQNLKWIVAIILNSGVRGEELKGIFNGLKDFGDKSRFQQAKEACDELGLFSSSILF